MRGEQPKLHNCEQAMRAAPLPAALPARTADSWHRKRRCRSREVGRGHTYACLTYLLTYLRRFRSREVGRARPACDNATRCNETGEIPRFESTCSVWSTFNGIKSTAVESDALILALTSHRDVLTQSDSVFAPPYTPIGRDSMRLRLPLRFCGSLAACAISCGRSPTRHHSSPCVWLSPSSMERSK